MFYRGSIVKSFEDPLPVLPKKAKKKKWKKKKEKRKEKQAQVIAAHFEESKMLFSQS